MRASCVVAQVDLTGYQTVVTATLDNVGGGVTIDVGDNTATIDTGKLGRLGRQGY